MKPPELIKKGLEQCASTETCENCGYRDECMDLCSNKPMTKDALAYIRRLEAWIDHAEKVARECAKSITENLDKLPAKLFQLESDNETQQKRIEELESRLAQVERERDAAVMDIETAINSKAGLGCHLCKHNGVCDRFECVWEWRGVCEANTEEETE